MIQKQEAFSSEMIQKQEALSSEIMQQEALTSEMIQKQEALTSEIMQQKAFSSEMIQKQEALSSEMMQQKALTSEMIQKQEALSSEVKPILASVKTLDHRITPSEGCKSNYLNTFTELVSTLTLPVVNLSMIVDIIVDDCRYPEFKWAWKGKTEKDSYEPVVNYLHGIDIDCQCIASGNGLPNGLLYEIDIYSLRSRSKTVEEINAGSYNQSYTDLSKKFTLSGRSDIFVYRKKPRLLYRHHCEYCIEIKTVDEMSQDALVLSSLREACLQLIGLNVDNPYKSPAVVLTNLVGKNYVLYLTIGDNPEESLCYNLHVHRFDKFINAIWWVGGNLVGRASCTSDLGRAPSLRNSIVELDADDEAQGVHFDNVQLTEVMDVDALEDNNPSAIIEQIKTGI
jgi:hypothetical protein